MNHEMSLVKASTTLLSLASGKSVSCSHDILSHLYDGKTVEAATGCKGAYCQVCHAPLEEGFLYGFSMKYHNHWIKQNNCNFLKMMLTGHQCEKIQAGFHDYRSMEKTDKLARELADPITKKIPR